MLFFFAKSRTGLRNERNSGPKEVINRLTVDNHFKGNNNLGQRQWKAGAPLPEKMFSRR